MEQERKLPKNIRQMAEKEERARIYLEDYVYTFVHKKGFSGEVRTGILLGEKAIVENENCWFVKGAVEVDGEAAEGATFTKQIWEQTQAAVQEYFADCSVCGWFISSTEEDFPDKEELKKMHMSIFPGENCLMYWKSGEEDSFWMEDEKRLIHLKGYYVYYEKNVQMQEYMLSRKEEPGESVGDEAARNFRKIMKEKQENKPHSLGKGVAKRKAAKASQNEKTHSENMPAREIGMTKETTMKVGIAAAAVLAVIGTAALAGNIGPKKGNNSVQALAVGASVERHSGMASEETEGSAKEGTGKSSSEANKNGSIYHDDAEVSNGVSSGEEDNKVSKDSLAQVSDGEKAEQTHAEADSALETQSAAASAELFSGDMLFYKDGLGAKVYRITAPAVEETLQERVEETTEETTGETIGETTGGTTGGTTGETIGAEAQAQQAGAGVADRPASYTVQPGDTLIAISNKFYGSSGMVMQLKEANGLEDINKIYIGQELELP